MMKTTIVVRPLLGKREEESGGALIFKSGPASKPFSSG